MLGATLKGSDCPFRLGSPYQRSGRVLGYSKTFTDLAVRTPLLPQGERVGLSPSGPRLEQCSWLGHFPPDGPGMNVVSFCKGTRC